MKQNVPGVLRIINRLEDGFLVSMLFVMVVLAIAQIIYRNVFGEGIVWIDPLLRVLVLWVAIGGAMVATRTNNHIRIDYFTRYFSKSVLQYVQRAVYLFSAGICGLISWHAARFVQLDYEYQTIAFANVPAWFTELVIPVGFLLMSLRYLLLCVQPPPEKEA